MPGELNEKGTAWLNRIRFSASHLRQIVDDLISTVMQERGGDIIHPESVTAAAVVREALALIEPSAREKGLDVRVRTPAPSPVLFTDARKVRQILTNLLFNPVKFTDSGSIELEVEQTDHTVRFHVRDTGIGMAEADLERIFEPFVQVDPSSTRRFGGCGLDLGLGRRFARALGGDLTVTGNVASGSTFTLEVPLEFALAPRSLIRGWPDARVTDTSATGA